MHYRQTATLRNNVTHNKTNSLFSLSCLVPSPIPSGRTRAECWTGVHFVFLPARRAVASRIVCLHGVGWRCQGCRGTTWWPPWGAPSRRANFPSNSSRRKKLNGHWTSPNLPRMSQKLNPNPRIQLQGGYYVCICKKSQKSHPFQNNCNQHKNIFFNPST